MSATFWGAVTGFAIFELTSDERDKKRLEEIEVSHDKFLKSLRDFPDYTRDPSNGNNHGYPAFDPQRHNPYIE